MRVMKTAFITGTSSGIGKETALYFSKRNWHVIATMRNPNKRETGLEKIENIELLHLDVTDIDSIKKAIEEINEKKITIDALVNNAGYATFGPFEASTHESVMKQYHTNVLGLMDVTREFIPLFRKQKQGTIINISSIAGRMTFPFYSVYNSTKWAVEGFSEAIQFELKPFNIKVKIVEPGLIKTDFYGRSKDVKVNKTLSEYDPLFNKILYYEKNNIEKENFSYPDIIAKEIFKAATDESWKLRYYAGRHARTIIWLRRLLPEGLFIKLLSYQTLK